MKRSRRFVLVLGVLGVLVASQVHAAGITTPFIDVDAGRVSAGRSTPVVGPGGTGLWIFNKEDYPVHVHLEAASPHAAVGAAAAPVPDVRWIAIAPADVRIPSHQSAVCRIMVTIPEEDRYRGRRYEVAIVTTMVADNPAGLQVKAGLQSRIRFKVQ